MHLLKCFASCPKGVESLLAQELSTLGAIAIKETRAGIAFEAELTTAYRICLWSRLANQILAQLATHTIQTFDDIYQVARNFPWQEHMTVENSFALAVDLINAPVKNDQFALQRFKDGLADYWRAETGKRPNVQLRQPDLSFHVLIKNTTLTLSISLSGDSLHRRGYRLEGGGAPLKENLAAALLLRAGWPEIARQGGCFFDPLCGSGTLLIEAALMASDSAPGLYRSYFGFLHWQEFMPATWKKLIAEAEERRATGLATLPKIIGHDASASSIRLAQAAVERAQLSSYIHLSCEELARCHGLTANPGLILTNPPYGERLGEQQQLLFTYQHLGDIFKNYFSKWRCSVFTGNPECAKALKLGPENIYRFFNGALPCQLLNFIIRPAMSARAPELQPPQATDLLSEGADFANRLAKNERKLHAWAKKENVSCYRLYDADLPDYSVAIDRYEQFIHIQEYAAPKTIDPQKAEHRLEIIVAQVSHLFQVSPTQLFLKKRTKQKGLAQYQKQANTGKFHTIHEGAAKFLVNFTDYLDTGLFLDTRLVRAWIFNHARGKSFLNLFCYTGTATVCAALTKAASTTSIDLSATYLEWAKRNIALNGLTPDKHTFIQADCLQWLAAHQKKFELILLDPPTFSNSKRMEETLDIQRDHVVLIDLAMKHLTRDGTLIFVTNKRQFQLADKIYKDYVVQPLKSIPVDFARRVIHQAYLMTHRQE